MIAGAGRLCPGRYRHCPGLAATFKRLRMGSFVHHAAGNGGLQEAHLGIQLSNTNSQRVEAIGEVLEIETGKIPART
jgi:hypothetical protein